MLQIKDGIVYYFLSTRATVSAVLCISLSQSPLFVRDMSHMTIIETMSCPCRVPLQTETLSLIPRERTMLATDNKSLERLQETTVTEARHSILATWLRRI
jgi:hypothetical protein